MSIHRALAAAFALTVAAGVSLGPARADDGRREPVRIAEPPPGKAYVVFFRKGQLADVLVGLTVREGKTRIGPLGYDRYLVAIVDPGLHTFSFGQRLWEMQLVTEAGEIYYVRCALGQDIVSSSAPAMTPAEERQFNDVSWQLKPEVPYATQGGQAVR